MPVIVSCLVVISDVDELYLKYGYNMPENKAPLIYVEKQSLGKAIELDN